MLVLVVSVGICLSAGANWVSRVRRLDRLETFSKPAATISVAGLAAVLGHERPAAVLLSALVGFLFCLAGDVALLDAVDSFIVGLAAFLLAHVAFVVMFFSLGLERQELGLIGLVLVVALIATVGRRIVRGAKHQDAKLVGPVIAYLTVISTMVVVGWSTGNVAATVGSTLFVVSDAILGWRAFVGERRWMALAVMVTYHGALVGLALALV